MQNKEIYTTGEASKILGVSLQTIIRNFDTGDLKGFQIPGSKHRRIQKKALCEYAKNEGLPAKEMLELEPTIDIFSNNSEFITSLKESVKNINLSINAYKSIFDLGINFFQVLENIRFAPRILIIDVDSCSKNLANIIIGKLKDNKEFNKTAIWGISKEDNLEKEFNKLTFDKFLSNTEQTENLYKLVLPFADI